jgi:hypothetical protein
MRSLQSHDLLTIPTVVAKGAKDHRPEIDVYSRVDVVRCEPAGEQPSVGLAHELTQLLSGGDAQLGERVVHMGFDRVQGKV